MKRRQALKILAGGAGLTIAPSFLLPNRKQALAEKLSLDSDDIYWLVSEPWLKMIADAEGTGNLGAAAYQTTYRYGKFEGYGDHPRIDIPIPGDPRKRTSDAAGPYQIISTTWDRTRAEYPDIWLAEEPAFSPANQDLCALALSHCNGASDALLAGVKVLNGHLSVSYASFKKAIYLDSREWASLPGHNIGADSGQKTKSMDYLWTSFQWHLWEKCGYYRSIVSPVEKMEITSGFGWRWGRMHQGIDLAAAEGSPVRSPENATVVKVGSAANAGLHAVLSPDGFPEMQISLCHLQRVDVRGKDRVRAGEAIALSGSTGRVTGPHLHVGVWIDDGVIDPYRYMMMSQWFKKGG